MDDIAQNGCQPEKCQGRDTAVGKAHSSPSLEIQRDLTGGLTGKNTDRADIFRARDSRNSEDA
jgi:hypothetical protein